MVEILLDTADGASDTIFNITGAMKEISQNLQQQQMDEKNKQLINSTTIKLETQGSAIKTHASKNRNLIQKGLKTSYIFSLLPLFYIYSKSI